MNVRRCMFNSSGETTTQGRVLRISPPREGGLSLPLLSVEARRRRFVEKPIVVVLAHLLCRLGPPSSRTLRRYDDDRATPDAHLDLIAQPGFLDERLRQPHSSRVPDTNQPSLHK